MQLDFNTRLNLSCMTKLPSQLNSKEEDKKVSSGIYVKPVGVTQKQEDTIERAITELSCVKFPLVKKIQLKLMGINPPFKNGAEAVKFLREKGAEVSYADFSNKSVHACLDTTSKRPAVLINSDYKNMATPADIFAISEALFHEAGHAKDCDSENSIQEELDCLALNVLAHNYYKKEHEGIFDNQTASLYTEGVNLYDELFFEKGGKKERLKQRVSDKYGYLDISSPGHPPSKIAREIKEINNG